MSLDQIMRPFLVSEDNSDRFYIKTYFFNEILKYHFFSIKCSSNKAKAVDFKIISPMSLRIDRSFCLGKNQSLKAVSSQIKYEQYHFFYQQNCIFKGKFELLISLPPLMKVNVFYAKRFDKSYIFLYQKACLFWAFSLIIFE